MFVAGLAVSLFRGVAQSPEVLVGARFLQGIGGALTSAVILAMFPKPRDQARAIGIYAFVPPPAGRSGCCRRRADP